MRKFSTLKHLGAKKLVLPGIFFFLFSFSSQAQFTYNNNNRIDIMPADEGPMPGSVYPSKISVSGLFGTISNVTVTLHGLKHNFPSGLDILLVAPNGTNITLLSDVGGAIDVPNPIDIVLKDGAAATLPDDEQLTAGEYKPTDLNIGDADSWPSPMAPEGPVPASSGKTTLSTFKGINPNGDWRLFVVNDDDGSIGYINGWSMSITTQSETLPVTLESFTPSYLETQGSVMLKWTTANEVNSHSFLVEASVNGSDWKALGSVKAAGTTVHRQHYQYQDNQPFSGKSYYRLKQIDVDGTTMYSKVVSVNAVLPKSYTDPVYRITGSSFPGVYITTTPREKFSLFLIDMSGKVLIKKQDVINNGSSYYLDIQNLSSGMYVLKVISRTQVSTQKFLLAK